MTRSRLTQAPISAEHLKQQATYPDCGGIVMFEGVVRNHHDGKSVTHLFYEAYVPMAEKVLSEIEAEITGEYPECRVRLYHRHGELAIGDVAVAIVVWAPHRKEAFVACEEAIDRIKQRVPIWKREFYANGTDAWVRCHHGSSDKRGAA